MRIRSGLTGPAKKICSSEYELPSAEEEYRKFCEKRFEEFMEMTKDMVLRGTAVIREIL